MHIHAGAEDEGVSILKVVNGYLVMTPKQREEVAFDPRADEPRSIYRQEITPDLHVFLTLADAIDFVRRKLA